MAATVAAARRGATKAVADETKAVAKDMRHRAPVGDSSRGKRGKPPLGDSIEATHSGLNGTAKAKARHAGIVEHGTKSHPAQPFAGPAAETARRRFPKRLADDVREAIE
ncbi:MAG TPA: HK97-gp10 family putative phage morphogenesis protein [Acidimicrobiales bacterium]|nr:HK97-gp10 family putative phage morphogenesis protein [Acidimicrobiales bacterium]